MIYDEGARTPTVMLRTFNLYDASNGFFSLSLSPSICVT